MNSALSTSLTVLLVLSLLTATFSTAFRRRLLRCWAKLSQSKKLAITFVCVVSMIISVSLWMRCDRQPCIHDEFSYLLAGDTFAHGQLSNPAHPMAHHLETFHVNQTPAYCSLYPPGQGLFLALGQRFLGDPRWGVCLSLALACGAFCWMLQAWVPSRWALAGGMIAAIHPNLLSWWGHTYFGGAVAMLGGALLFGAIRRLFINPSLPNSLALVMGVALLANTRPFEGFITCIAPAILFGIWVFRGTSASLGKRVWTTVLPVSLSAVALALIMANYNRVLTGNPFLMPYMANANTYSIVPLFLFHDARPIPEYSFPEFREYHVEWALAIFSYKTTFNGYCWDMLNRVTTFHKFYFGPALTLPLLVLPLVFRSRWMRFAGMIVVALLGSHTLTTWFNPHYIAPVACLILMLTLQGFRHLRIAARHQPLNGQIAARLCSLLFVLGSLLTFLPFEKDVWGLHRPWSKERQRIVNDLEAMNGSHLVIVQYSDDHSCHDEWVFNDANIDASHIVWARDLGRKDNLKLAKYFSERQSWTVEADSDNPILMPLLATDVSTQSDKVALAESNY